MYQGSECALPHGAPDALLWPQPPHLLLDRKWRSQILVPPASCSTDPRHGGEHLSSAPAQLPYRTPCSLKPVPVPQTASGHPERRFHKNPQPDTATWHEDTAPSLQQSAASSASACFAPPSDSQHSQKRRATPLL